MDQLFRVRRARRADVEAIARVHVESWLAAYHGIIPESELHRFDFATRSITWQRALEGGAEVWVVTEDNLIIGFAEVRGNEIPLLYLHPGWWRLGVGTMLLTRMLRRIAAAGHREAHLWVLADNMDARAFYARLGGEAGEDRSVSVGAARLAEVRYTWRLPVTAR